MRILLLLVDSVLKQKPITLSEQYPWARVTAFFRSRFFLELFGANFDYVLNSINQSAKPTDLKVIFSAF